jgi:hypothetical protein
MKMLIAASLVAGLAAPALAAPDAPAPEPRAGDAPADAGMTLEQFQAEARTRLLQADADHDGRLSPAELAAARAGGRGGPAEGRGPGGRRDPARMFQMMDANGDGFIDAAEIDALSARRFQRMDADGDGKVTAAEREAGRGRWRERMGGGNAGGGAWGGGDQSDSGQERPDD